MTPPCLVWNEDGHFDSASDDLPDVPFETQRDSVKISACGLES
jgi:hypothetical protein